MSVTLSENQVSYNCIERSCIDPNDGSGTYTTLFNCQATCGTNAINEVANANTRELLKIVDLLGKTATQKQEGILFYIYSDGTVEKRIVIE
jgi:hypothetical protein